MNEFIGRQWLFNYIYSMLIESNKNDDKSKQVIVITGSLGSGKSAICAELVSPQDGCDNMRLQLSNQIIYFNDLRKQSHTSLTEYLYKSLNKAIVTNFKELIDINEDTNDLYETLKQITSKLSSIKQNYLIVIDSSEVLLTSDDTNSEFIKFLNCNDLPKCLKLILTCRQNAFITHLKPTLNNYEQISLDKIFSILDITYMNNVLFKDACELVAKLSHSNSSIQLYYDLINKSNSNFLYLKKVIDLLNKEIIDLDDIKDLPNNLNDLYLYLVNKIPKDNLSLAKSIFSLFVLNENQSFTKRKLFDLIKLKHIHITESSFDQFFTSFHQLFLAKLDQEQSSDSTATTTTSSESFSSFLMEDKHVKCVLFHSSFREWLLVSKLNYIYDFNEAYELKCMYYWSKLCKLEFQMPHSSTPCNEISKLNIGFNLVDNEDYESIRFIDDDSENDHMRNMISNEKKNKTLNKFNNYLEKCQSLDFISSLKKHYEQHLSNINLEINSSTSTNASFSSLFNSANTYRQFINSTAIFSNFISLLSVNRFNSNAQLDACASKSRKNEKSNSYSNVIKKPANKVNRVKDFFRRLFCNCKCFCK